MSTHSPQHYSSSAALPVGSADAKPTNCGSQAQGQPELSLRRSFTWIPDGGTAAHVAHVAQLYPCPAAQPLPSLAAHDFVSSSLPSSGGKARRLSISMPPCHSAIPTPSRQAVLPAWFRLFSRSPPSRSIYSVRGSCVVECSVHVPRTPMIPNGQMLRAKASTCVECGAGGPSLAKFRSSS
ncbi:unnamed protein product [Cutaneotrichosporon oleaginosum]